MVVFWALLSDQSATIQIAAIVALSVLGWFCTDQLVRGEGVAAEVSSSALGSATRGAKLHDPGWIVIDEWAGIWITLIRLPNYSLTTLALAFALFRLFDIWKPFPLKLLERAPGGLGIMADDIGAGILARGVLAIALTFVLA